MIPEESKNFRLLGHDASAGWGGGSLVEVRNGHAYVALSADRPTMGMRGLRSTM